MLSTQESPVAKKRAEHRDRLDLRVEAAWVLRIQAQADRFGLSVSAYVRQGATEKLERDEATDTRAKGKR